MEFGEIEERKGPLETWSSDLKTIDKILDAIPHASVLIKAGLLHYALDIPEIKEIYENLRKVFPTSEIPDLEAMKAFVKSKSFVIGRPPLPVKKAVNQLATPIPVNMSTIFTLTNRQIKRRMRARELVLETPTVQILCTGEELRRDEYDYFLELMDLSKESYGEPYFVKPSEILRRSGRTDTGPNRTKLIESLYRMYATALSVIIKTEEGSKTVREYHNFHLIEEFSFRGKTIKTGEEEITDSLHIRLNPQIVKLFQRNQYALIDRNMRNSIRSGIAKWMFDLIRGEKRNIQTFRLSRIVHALGSQHKTTSPSYGRGVRFRVKSALEELCTRGLIQEAWLSAAPHGKPLESKIILIVNEDVVNPDWLNSEGERFRLTTTNELIITKTSARAEQVQMKILL